MICRALEPFPDAKMATFIMVGKDENESVNKFNIKQKNTFLVYNITFVSKLS